MKIYHTYRMDAHGAITALIRFRADSDALACERAGEIMAEGEWRGIELWENMRQVHCKGIARIAADMPEFPPKKIAAVARH
jgi:hypothetical protein